MFLLLPRLAMFRHVLALLFSHLEQDVSLNVRLYGHIERAHGTKKGSAQHTEVIEKTRLDAGSNVHQKP